MVPPVPDPKSKATLTGRVVTMNDQFTVHTHGAIYIDDGDIIDVRAAGAPAPDGF